MVQQGHFSLLMAVWVPPDQGAPADIVPTLQSSLDHRLSRLAPDATFNVHLTLLPAKSTDTKPETKPAVQWRLKVVAPQRPGIMLGITQLLKDQGCEVSAMDALTRERDGKIWFELECLVEVPPTLEADEVGERLKFWGDNSGPAGVAITWDEWANINPLSHA